LTLLLRSSTSSTLLLICTFPLRDVVGLGKILPTKRRSMSDPPGRETRRHKPTVRRMQSLEHPDPFWFPCARTHCTGLRCADPRFLGIKSNSFHHSVFLLRGNSSQLPPSAKDFSSRPLMTESFAYQVPGPLHV